MTDMRWWMVTGAALCLGAGAGAGAAVAGDTDRKAFETMVYGHCFAALEAVEPVSTEGLSKGAATDGFLTPLPGDAAVWSHGLDGPRIAVSGAGDAGHLECRVLLTGNKSGAAEAAETFDAFATEAIAAGIYRPVEEDTRHLESDGWREPVMRAELTLSDDGSAIEIRVYEIPEEA